MVGNVFLSSFPTRKGGEIAAGGQGPIRAWSQHRSTTNITDPAGHSDDDQPAHPMLYDNDNSWLVVTLILLVGASIRHFSISCILGGK